MPERGRIYSGHKKMAKKINSIITRVTTQSRNTQINSLPHTHVIRTDVPAHQPTHEPIDTPTNRSTHHPSCTTAVQQYVQQHMHALVHTITYTPSLFLCRGGISFCSTIVRDAGERAIRPREVASPRAPLAESVIGARSFAGVTEGCCVERAWRHREAAGGRAKPGCSFFRRFSFRVVLS